MLCPHSALSLTIIDKVTHKCRNTKLYSLMWLKIRENSIGLKQNRRMQSSMFAFENNGLFVLYIFVPVPLFSVEL